MRLALSLLRYELGSPGRLDGIDSDRRSLEDIDSDRRPVWFEILKFWI